MIPDRDQLLSRFLQPPAAYRPMMFWIWNGDLNRDAIRRQVADMAYKGCGGFFLHPMGEHFRLKDFVKGQWPAYLSDEYFDAVRVAVEAAAENRLYAWLYDEGGWPSGTAQGQVLDGHAEHTAQVLRFEAKPAAEVGQTCACPDGTIAALASFQGHWPEPMDIVDGHVSVPKGAETVLMYVVTRAEGRVNLMSQGAVRRFIDVTHERYAEWVGEYFGGVIPGMFTDEPAVAGRVASQQIPWSDHMLESFRDARGFDLRPFLPVLFSHDGMPESVVSHFAPGVVAQVRCEFSDHWTDLYHNAYWRQIGDWCEEHSLIHTGHVGGEDNLPDHGKHGFGHFFKTAGALHAPGVDVIWRQLHWEKENFSFPLFASSAAHQRPGQGGAPDEESPFDNLVVTETNGVYGYGLSFEQMRWLVDYQCMRGINLIGPMSYSYETAGGRLYRTMDHIGVGNPQWELYREFADYVGRLCAVMRSGVALADLAVYYPIEACWSAPEGPQADRAWESLQSVTTALEAEQISFDFIDASTIEAATIAQGALETPGQFYSTILVPHIDVLPAAVASRLRELHDSGGRVAFISQIPTRDADYGEDDVFTGAIAALSSVAVTMDVETELHGLGGDTRAGLDEAARWNGLSAGLGIPRGTEHFGAEVLVDDAVLIVPERETGRFARLMALRTGHYKFQPGEIIPELRLAVREVGQLQVAFMMNEGREQIEFPLEIVTDRPAVVEQWRPADGSVELLALHSEISEITRVPIRLAPGESALLVLSPLDEQDEAPTGRATVRRLPEHVVIDSLDQPETVSVMTAYRITSGDAEIVDEPPELSSLPPQLGPWSELGLADFSGTIAYEFAFTVAADYLGDQVFLDLGQVLYAAQVSLNGEDLPGCLFPPFVVEVSRFLRAGDNRLTVMVTNTLANQVCAADVVEEARQYGWLNTYYERSLPMMQESLKSGLIGPVRLYIEA